VLVDEFLGGPCATLPWWGGLQTFPLQPDPGAAPPRCSSNFTCEMRRRTPSSPVHADDHGLTRLDAFWGFKDSLFQGPVRLLFGRFISAFFFRYSWLGMTFCRTWKGRSQSIEVAFFLCVPIPATQGQWAVGRGHPLFLHAPKRSMDAILAKPSMHNSVPRAANSFSVLGVCQPVIVVVAPCGERCRDPCVDRSM
jgi:hypothetical protein